MTLATCGCFFFLARWTAECESKDFLRGMPDVKKEMYVLERRREQMRARTREEKEHFLSILA
jgi:hypothetical protein